MIELDGVFFKEIVEHGLREFPNEACGLLAGKDSRPTKVFTMRNADASPASYRLDPREQLHVTKEIEERGWTLFAIYHSHTHSEGYPSETDRMRASHIQPFYPDAYYLILSLSDRENPVLRTFRILDGEVTEEELNVS